MYWFVGLGSKNENGEKLFKIEDDIDGVVEELTKDEIENAVRHGSFIKYREGAVEENGEYIGKRFKTDCFDVIPIYVGSHGVLFCFLDELGIIVKRASRDINKSTKLHRYIKDCFAQLRFNNQGDKYKVLYAKHCEHIYIEFIDYKTTNWTTYRQIEKGEVTDGLVYHFGIADISNTHYLYAIWHNMISRCKNPKDKAYSWYGAVGVDVDESFRRASDFVKWYESQPNYKVLIDSEVIINVDKDLIGKKLYSKDTCYLLPIIINSGFLTNKASKCRGDVPIYCTTYKGYIRVQVNYNYIKHSVFIDSNRRMYIIADSERDTTFPDEYYYDLMMQFFNSRNITPQWNYNLLVKAGQKWVAAKNYVEKYWYRELKEELEKGWITQEIYDLLLPLVEVHITD